MKIYLTTDLNPTDMVDYACWIWRNKPLLDNGRWVSNRKHGLFIGYYRNPETIASLGFPPPGDMRVVTIPPYEEDNQ